METFVEKIRQSNYKTSVSFIKKNQEYLCKMPLKCYDIFEDEDFVKKLFEQIPDICKYISYELLSNRGPQITNFINYMNVNEKDMCDKYIISSCVVRGYEDLIKLVLSKGFDICKCPYLFYTKQWPENILDTIVVSDIISKTTKYHQQDTFLVFGDHSVTKIKELNPRFAINSFTETMNIIKLLDAGIDNVVKVGTNQRDLTDVIRDRKTNKLYLCLTIDRYDGELNYGDGINGEWVNIWNQCSAFLNKLHTIGIVHADVKIANILKRKTATGKMEYIVSDYETFIANSDCNCMLFEYLDVFYKLSAGSYITHYQSPINDIGCLLMAIMNTVTDILYDDIIFDKARQLLNYISPRPDSYSTFEYDDFLVHELLDDYRKPITICIYIILELARDTYIILNENIPIELKILYYNNIPKRDDILIKNLRDSSITKDLREFIEDMYEEMSKVYSEGLVKFGIE